MLVIRSFNAPKIRLKKQKGNTVNKKSALTWEKSNHTLKKWSQSCSVLSTLCDPIDYSPWNSLGQNTGEGSISLLQEIFPNQGSNPGLLHCRQIFLPAEPQEKPTLSRIPSFFSGTKVLEEIFYHVLTAPWMSRCSSLQTWQIIRINLGAPKS